MANLQVMNQLHVSCVSEDKTVVLLTRTPRTVSKASQVVGSKLISGAGGPAVLADEPPRRGHDVLLVAAPLVVVQAEVVADLVRHDVDRRQTRRGVRLAGVCGCGAQLADDAVPRAGADRSDSRQPHGHVLKVISLMMSALRGGMVSYL